MPVGGVLDTFANGAHGRLACPVGPGQGGAGLAGDVAHPCVYPAFAADQTIAKEFVAHRLRGGAFRVEAPGGAGAETGAIAGEKPSEAVVRFRLPIYDV